MLMMLQVLDSQCHIDLLLRNLERSGGDMRPLGSKRGTCNWPQGPKEGSLEDVGSEKLKLPINGLTYGVGVSYQNRPRQAQCPHPTKRRQRRVWGRDLQRLAGEGRHAEWTAQPPALPPSPPSHSALAHVRARLLEWRRDAVPPALEAPVGLGCLLPPPWPGDVTSSGA